MNKKFILVLLIVFLMSCFTTVFAYNSDELNKRLIACKPTKDFNAGSSVYQISGLTGSTCVFKILYSNTSNKPDLICRVPSSRMREITSFNPLTVQGIKKQYCKISIKSVNKQMNVFY